MLGSRSTYGLGALGGLEGRTLQAGDELAVGVRRRRRRPGAPCPRRCRPGLPKELEVRVVMGLYDHLLTDDGPADCSRDDVDADPGRRPGRLPLQGRGSTWKSASSRSAPAATRRTSSTPPYPIGSIQVPGGVEPIVLHRDAVSGGGYAMIATVISADMDPSAAVGARRGTRFVAVDLEAALAARRERAEHAEQAWAALGLQRRRQG